MDNSSDTNGIACMICELIKIEGIRICDQFICEDCESEMVRTDVKDHKYPFYVHQMKRIWYKSS